ncbi:hypothetical protein BHE74_00047188 [Ensete ventricosum]|nr:hypothetical protein BHE74_00047188 [Ensete ventricosum]
MIHSLRCGSDPFYERYGEYWQQNAPPLADHVVKVPPRPPPPPPFASRPPHPPNHSPPAPPPPMVSGSGGSGSNYSGSEVPLTPPSPGVALGFSKSTFTYDELARATDGFSEANLLGQGGFGYVHRGVLPNGKEVAVKQLKTGSGQGEREFQAEVEIISRVHHKHLVSLVGYCISGGRRLLVYEFVPNNTLEFHLHVKIDRRRSIEEEKGKRKKKRKRRKKKRRKRRKKKRKSTSPACPHRPRAVAGTDKMSVRRSVTIDFDRRHPLPGGISLAAARLVAAREKEARERGRRRGEQEGEPQMVPPSSGEATARLLETCDEENRETSVTSPHLRGEEKPRRLLIRMGEENEAMFALPGGKAPYRATHTVPPVDLYADRLVIDRQRSISIDINRGREKEEEGEKPDSLAHCSSPVPPRYLSLAGDSFSLHKKKERGDITPFIF